MKKMSKSLTNLKEYKTKKQIDIIAKDLSELQLNMTKCLTLLQPYKKYIPAMECISTIINSKSIIDIHLNKYKRLKDAKLE